ncbi:MAG: NPCBM/NEW2 domain-containing protein [Cytophagaceae bacterium]|nr:NPCBM/NEW2 domain-containing protein [Cytophagaceae bacterium]
MIKRFSAVLFFILVIGNSFAQINISTPINKAVYQRNAASQANLYIQGTYQQSNITSIEARLINPLDSSPISGFDWAVIHNMPNLGYFTGQLSNVPGGWYILEVRSKRAGVVIETNSVNRVGIGDVFMVAGQSNAQGYINTGGYGLGSSKEYVVTHDNGMYCSLADIPFPSFTKIESTTKLGTGGRDAWCYGKLGDLISDVTQLPVAIFNSGASGASSENFKVSSDGGATDNIFISPPANTQFCADELITSGTGTIGMPYINFKRGLNFYNSMFGIKSVLFHQGESDAYTFVLSSTYSSNINYVINKTRSDFHPNLPWMIAQVSYIGGTAYSPVTSAQSSLVNQSNQIFGGPNTDGINNNTLEDSRDDIDLHFTNPIGLDQLAGLWATYIVSSNFTNNVVPIVANTPPVATATISGNNVLMSVPSGYASYKWIRTDVSGNSNFGNASEGTGNTLSKSSGTYRCWVLTANGNMQISNPVNATQSLLMIDNGATCSENVYLSDLNMKTYTNGVGPVEINKTNGSESDGDGSTIILKGTSYSKGIGVSANSEIEYSLPANQYYKFQAKIGISDDISNTCDNTGGVIFKVYGDGNLIYTSPTIYRNTDVQDINLSIFNYSVLKLKVEEVNNNIICNKGVWADARLLCFLGDTTLPSDVTNLVASDTLSKCISFSWTHATDDFVVNGYYVFLNGIPLDTIPGNQNTYTVKGLSPGDFVNFGIKAFDAANNQSPNLVNKILNTVEPNVVYGGDGYICTSRNYLPTIKIPDGGTFTISTTTPHTINSLTGDFFSAIPDQFFGTYYFGTGVPGCEANLSFTLGTTTPPACTPVITADKTLINQGAEVNFTSTSCTTGTLVWSFTPSNNTTQSISPTATNNYYSACQISFCLNYSNTVEVKVLPNCGSSVNLTNPADNLGSRINSLIYNSSNNIIATNQITPSNNIQYNAANTILLSPGFKIDPGVIFSAKIQNCP